LFLSLLKQIIKVFCGLLIDDRKGEGLLQTDDYINGFSSLFLSYFLMFQVFSFWLMMRFLCYMVVFANFHNNSLFDSMINYILFVLHLFTFLWRIVNIHFSLKKKKNLHFQNFNRKKNNSSFFHIPKSSPIYILRVWTFYIIPFWFFSKKKKIWGQS
jgi:hypothetical protein